MSKNQIKGNLITKREIAATATAACVGLVLTVGSSILIEKLKTNIHDRIVNEEKEEIETAE